MNPDAAPEQATGGDDVDREPIAINSALLGDVASPVVVELGRIEMNVAQVAQLSAGQVLRLPRSPQDPVCLTIDGKLFARAELVEVDGELGVRLLSMTTQ